MLRRRRQIAADNIRRCFADKSPAQQTQLVRDHFSALGLMAMEMLIAWWRNENTIPAKSTISGLEHLQTALAQGKGVLLLSAHFTCLEIGGALLKRDTKLTIHGMYRRHENPVIEHVMRTLRQRWFDVMIPRDDAKTMLRSLKQGGIVWYASDQAYRGRNSVLAPFFGHLVTTNPGTSRIAKLSGAPIVPYFPLRKGNTLNYELRILPPLSTIPSGDLIEDATVMNQLIEEQIKIQPEQYYWVHRRFKT